MTSTELRQKFQEILNDRPSHDQQNEVETINQPVPSQPDYRSARVPKKKSSVLMFFVIFIIILALLTLVPYITQKLSSTPKRTYQVENTNNIDDTDDDDDDDENEIEEVTTEKLTPEEKTDPLFQSLRN